MPSNDRRADARRRSPGRGPASPRVESLEGRQLLAGAVGRADLLGISFDTPHNLDWDDAFPIIGAISNQGGAATAVDTRADVYATVTPTIGPGAVYLGSVVIPAGLQPGGTLPFEVTMSLPPTPMPGIDVNGLIYVAMRVDPNGAVAEFNRANNEARGQGYDTSVVYITPRKPADLDGTSFGVYPDNAAWGTDIVVAAQVKNNGGGDAPPTRARLVLTPSDLPVGTLADVTVGDVEIPALSPYQTVNVQKQLTLPPAPAGTLAGRQQFVLSIVHDADYKTNPMTPKVADQGLGLDAAVITIQPGANADVAQGPKPDLAAAGVAAPGTIHWGQTIQVATAIQNVGQADAKPFQIQFFLTGANGTTDRAVYLGTIDAAEGLKAGYGQDFYASLKVPGRLPTGITLNSIGMGKIIAMVDGENRVDELFENNNASDSAPITLRVPGRDGNSMVPTGTTPTAPTATRTNGGLIPRAMPVTQPAPRPAPRPAPTARPQPRRVPRIAPAARPAIAPQSSGGSDFERGVRSFNKSVGGFFSDIGRAFSRRF